MPDGQTPPSEIAAPLARFNGEKPPAPDWFDKALARAPERSTFAFEGADIELLTWGQIGNPGLLFLHGNGASADWWSFIAPFFADDWRVAAFSWSGMGRSDWRATYTADGFARESFAAAEAAGLGVAGLPTFVAHSFGGFPTMLAASRYGERLRAAVLVDSVVRPPEREWRGPPRRVNANKVYPTLEAILARFRLAPPQGCENLYIADWIARNAVKAAEGGFTWRFDPFMWTSFMMEDRGPLLQGATCPIAMMWGDRSALVDPEILDYMRGLLPPGSPQLAIPDADHHVMIDQPLAFVAALRGLLSGWPR
ncbi:MAG: alpha/beta fold hydrolase [Pseudomonadota bacterium]